MKPSHSLRRFFLACAALVLIYGVLVVGTVREHLRQQQLDNALIAAIKRCDADTAGRA